MSILFYYLKQYFVCIIDQKDYNIYKINVFETKCIPHYTTDTEILGHLPYYDMMSAFKIVTKIFYLSFEQKLKTQYFFNKLQQNGV